ncbi:MAG: DNA polymerase/3'-5' exonuclease PolX [Rhodothermaceae bacterium]|nr:DNA polymerase/3'-5' exonuclease PolX [Rhodothermaceae bacterium]
MNKTNRAIARQLKLAADLIELTGGNAFRARAFGSAARRIERLEESVPALVAEGTLTDVAGVGQSLAADIAEFLDTGQFPAVAELLATLPPGLLDVLRVKGLGPKKVRVLWQDLDITSLDDLEAAAVAGRIAALSGFGAKTQQNVLDQIELLQSYAGKAHTAQIADEVEELVEALRTTAGIARAEAAGRFRRQFELVEDIDLVAEGSPEAIRDTLAARGVQFESAAHAPLRGTLPSGMRLAVHPAEAGTFGRVLWAATGSEAHVEQFVDRYGLPGDTDDEATLYTSVGLPVVAPALREGTDELEAAANGALPRLVTVEDFRGSLHNHTTASDGAHTLREMGDAARAMGLEYLGICDHSRSLQVANGLSIERLMGQVEAIADLNADYAADGGPAFRILSGTECDILSDGALDFPDEVLEQLDIVVASIHSAFQLGIVEQTARLVGAAENPHIDILGHPTGRLLLRREGYAIDHDAVIAACAATGTALELNANPWRLDLDWRWVRRATAAGVLIAINPDAHATSELALVRWGVAVAQKGWLTPEQCLNTKSADDLLAWARS